MSLRVLVFLALVSNSTQVRADLVPIVGSVTMVESSGLPDHFAFQMNAGAGQCGVGKNLIWVAQDVQHPVDNVKANYATVLAAMLSQRQIRVYFFSESALQSVWGADYCQISYIHAL
jgi:hypothetical protein